METEKEKVLPFYNDSVNVTEIGAHEASPRVSEADVHTESAPTNSNSDSSRKYLGKVETDDRLKNTLNDFTTTYVNTADGTVISDWNHLNNFYKRYNKVLLDKTALDVEKERLCKENQDLRVILKVGQE